MIAIRGQPVLYLLVQGAGNRGDENGEWYKNTRVVGSAACYQFVVTVLVNLGGWLPAGHEGGGLDSSSPSYPSSKIPTFPILY
jgi:hypothetical protein